MLHEVMRYAEIQGLESEVGFKSKRVRWLLVFRASGEFLEVIDLAVDDRKSKGREFPRCPDLSQPEMISTGSRHFLVDSLDKVVLLTKDQPTDKDIAPHASYVGLLKGASSAVPLLSVIAPTLSDEASLAAMREVLLSRKAKPTDSATIAVLDGATLTIFVANADWHDWWQGFRRSIAVAKQAKGASKSVSKKSPGEMRCLLSGELVTPVATQNKVSGLSDVGGLATGDVLSSFDKDAFGHFGFVQGQNAAMSETMVKKFTDSLNHLLQHRSHRLVGTKVAYWFSKPLAPEDDPIADIFGGEISAYAEDNTDFEASAQEGNRFQSRAARLLDSIRTGERVDLRDCQFFALTLSGNSGRVVIRDWMEGRFEQLAANIKSWFDDLSIVSRDGKRLITHHKFAAVLASFVRDLRDVPSPAVAALWQCALKNRPIPASLMAQTLARVRIDVIQGESARHARLGLLRAFCIRNPGVPSMTAEVDSHLDSPAYLCGRVMALLAAIQERALGRVGAGVIERYYAAASATPALVLGRLVRTAQVAHLPKIDSGLKHYFESQLSELWSRMKAAPPTVLSLEEQTLFAMGFYHQQAARFQKKQDDAVTVQ